MATYSLQARAPSRSANLAHNFTLRLNLVTHCSRKHPETLLTSAGILKLVFQATSAFYDGGVSLISDKSRLSSLVPLSQIKKGTSYPKKRSAEVSDTTQQVEGEITRSAPNI